MAAKQIWHYIKPWLFTLIVGCLYVFCLQYDPLSGQRAVEASSRLISQLGLPICFVLVMMTLINRYLDPAVVARFLGSRTGVRGVLLSALAGILSMGPIYAWYPLFKNLREKGASTFIIANFIGCRSVKPVLIPVLLAYFGWQFSIVFVLINLLGAMGTACLVALFCPTLQQ